MLKITASRINHPSYSISTTTHPVDYYFSQPTEITKVMQTRTRKGSFARSLLNYRQGIMHILMIKLY